eukprot:g32625.t1
MFSVVWQEAPDDEAEVKVDFGSLQRVGYEGNKALSETDMYRRAGQEAPPIVAAPVPAAIPAEVAESEPVGSQRAGVQDGESVRKKNSRKMKLGQATFSLKDDRDCVNPFIDASTASHVKGYSGKRVDKRASVKQISNLDFTHDHQFEELLSMKVAMDEFRAYILLRNSALSAEDKKRLIVESAGSLDYKTVVTNLKLLGSKFFQEVHAGKASSARSKTYEANAFVSHDAGSTELPSEDSAFHADDWNEEEWIEQLANDGDEDAALILDYEQPMLDTIQEDADLALSHTTYAEARKRLSDRFKNRGFWLSGPAKGKARGKGGEKGKKGFGGFRNSGNRKTLQQRILESTCRICGRKGHWKAECPERGRSSEAGQTTLATAPTLVTLEDGVDALPLEFMSLPEEPIEPSRDSSLTLSSFAFCFGVLGERVGPNAINEGEIIESNREAIEKPGMSCMSAHPESRSRKNAAHCAESFASTRLSTMPPEPAGSHFATYNSLGIIDTERHASTQEALPEKRAEKSSQAPRVRVVPPKTMESCSACRLELPDDLAANLAKEVLLEIPVPQEPCLSARNVPQVKKQAETEGDEYVAAAGDRLKLKVLSPEGDGITVACSEVILPSATGQLGILANHAPMMSALDTGVLRYKEDGTWKPVVVLGGFATVDSNQLSVLVNDFEKADGIDMKEAQSEMDSATSMLEKAENKKDKLEATSKVKKAAARLQAAMFLSKK